ncbi:MAG: YceI family protein [Bacteroidia bacterium]|jgi:polyisoprenoid-binding protein YceI|nr:YceI family protein [Bacteroidia bacterium]
MNNIFTFALLLAALVFNSCENEKTAATATKNPGIDTTDTEPNRLLPKKLRGLPVGMIGGHDPNPTTAVFENGMYVWKHNTSITSVAGDLKLIEYGSFVFTDEGWLLRVTMSPDEFAKTYNCPGAVLKQGITYTDPASWRRQEVLTGGDALWYYIAEDKNGKRYKGTALVETEASLAPASENDTAAVSFDPARCNVVWTGYGEVGDYSLTGTIPVKSGWCSFNGNIPKAGELVLNMQAMSHTNADLVSHLKSPDFFNTDKYPEARFVLTKAVTLQNDSCTITGNLTLCGITKPLSFTARIIKYPAITQLYADVLIDRTKWGVKYNSSSFFSGLGDQAIKNDMKVQFALTANTK